MLVMIPVEKPREVASRLAHIDEPPRIAGDVLGRRAEGLASIWGLSLGIAGRAKVGWIPSPWKNRAVEWLRICGPLSESERGNWSDGLAQNPWPVRPSTQRVWAGSLLRRSAISLATT